MPESRYLGIEASQFFDLLPDPMWVFDPATLKFLDVNGAAQRKLGFSRQQFLDMTIADIRPESDRPLIRMAVDTVSEGEFSGGVWRILTADGHSLYLDFHWRTMSFNGRRAILASTRDVTHLIQNEASALHGSARDAHATTLSRSILLRTRELEKANARLLEQDARLRMVQRLGLGLWHLDADAGRMEWSDNTYRIHHRSRHSFNPTFEAVLGLLHPEDTPSVRESFSSLLRGEANQMAMEYRILAPDGSVHYLRASAERTVSGGAAGLTGIVQDITDQVVSRLRADQMSSRLAQTFDHMGDAFYLLDPDYRFAFVNREASRLLQRPVSSLVGRVVWDEFPEARQSVLWQAYHDGIESQKAQHLEMYYPPLEAWFAIDAHPVPDGLAVYFRDVTSSHHAQDERRVFNERFHLLARATQDVIWDWDIPAGTLWCSENLGRLIGEPPVPETAGLDAWTQWLHPDDKERVMAGLLATIEGIESQWADEYRIRRGDGATRLVIDRGFVIRSEDGKPLRMIGSIMDITDQRHLEERLRQSQKLEAVGQLTGGVAHDFNNILTVILGNAELLAESVPEGSPAHTMASMTVSAAERGAQLTSRLLAFARRQPLEPRSLDLNALVSGLSGLLGRALKENIELEIVRGLGLWVTEVDPGQLEVALLNLVVNARDAMPEGGKLTIETANASLDDDYARQLLDIEPGQYVMLSVSDTGMGMTPETLAQVFEPFFTTKDVGKGSGLGLSMVYGFVRQSGGHVRIYSEPGEGTCVRMYFPRVHVGAVPEAALARPDTVEGGREHVLVVEDDTMVRDHLVSLLRGLGYRVTAASQARQALQKLRTDPTIDLLFTDIVMPGGMNGRELADIALAERPELKVLFTSGYTENAVVHHGRLDAGVQLLSKPYRRQALAAKLRKVLDTAGKP